uniref:Uncharacterized protein n=1 Tax=Poecilia reticulata TaxID=8081 RepID=A0A3P9QCX9_POERE
MARSRSDLLPLLPRRNARLDSFLKRNTEPALYERIRTHEPCVVVSDVINKVYMYAVLSDERVYLTEFPPRALTAAVSLERVRDIELVNDLPDFLSSKDRERCQHIRITYIPERPAEKEHDWLQREKRARLPPVAPPSRRASHCPIRTHGLKAWCPSWRFQVTRRIGSVLTRLLRRDRADFGEERDAELHLYVVSQTSTLYLHLQSCWNSFVIVVTRRDAFWSPPPFKIHRLFGVCSAERTAHLFAQLSSELLQDGVAVENVYLLLQELRTAAHRSTALRRLFWRTKVPGCKLLVSAVNAEFCEHISLADLISNRGVLSFHLGCKSLKSLNGLKMPSECVGFRNVPSVQTSRCFPGENFVSVSWILRLLHPAQSVLLFQRCRLLLACLQYNNQLAQHLQLNFREEFRWEIQSLHCRLPRYPICKPTVRLVQSIVTLIQRS